MISLYQKKYRILFYDNIFTVMFIFNYIDDISLIVLYITNISVAYIITI